MPLAKLTPPMLSVRPSPAACSPLDMFRSTGPHPLDEVSHDMSPTWYVPAAGGAASVPARVTRYITTPCEGTLALIEPDVVDVAPVQRLRSEYDDEPPSPTSAAEVVTVAAAPVRLNSTTAADPSDIGLAHTSVSPKSRTRRPCEPPQSWFTATTSALRMIDSVPADIERRSLPRISGAPS